MNPSNPGGGVLAGRASVGPGGPGGQAGQPGGLISGPSGPSGANNCAETNVQAGRKQPIVSLVIDGSGSMCAPFSGATRWASLRSALLDADGVVTKLQAVVSFGMTLYDGPLALDGLLTGVLGGVGGMANNPACALMGAQNSMTKACPNLLEVPHALNNAQAISGVYPMIELGGSTPTHKALTVVVDQLVAAQVMGPDQAVQQPQIIILATDGEPNELCPNPSGANPQAEVIAQVTRAAQNNIKTFVISLADGDPGLMNHLVSVAQAGMTGAPPFTPLSKEDLVSSLVQIIGGAVGCEITLNGTVMAGQECAGSVEMNGAALSCNDANGWVLKDERTLLLQGTACTMFMNDPLALLRANFPCGVFVPS